MQVHDLVDFVSEESALAGKSAAEYILHGKKEKNAIGCVNGKNVGYVLPQKLDKNSVGDVKLFFRVTGTFRNCVIKAECGGEVLALRKKRIAVPGEMETLILPYEKFKNAESDITVSLECEQ